MGDAGKQAVGLLLFLLINYFALFRLAWKCIYGVARRKVS